jgi:hypothetical protein
LEQLRDDLRRYGQESGELYFRVDKALRELANPNLHEVELAHAFRIELWDRYGKDNLRMTIAATSQGRWQCEEHWSAIGRACSRVVA